MAKKNKTNSHGHINDIAKYYSDLGVLPKPLPPPSSGLALDKGIERLVRALRYNGVQTDQSCEGGEGHCFPFPIVRFSGSQSEGYRAVSVALTYGYHVRQLNRVWYIDDGELTGPMWEIVLHSLRWVFESCTFNALVAFFPKFYIGFQNLFPFAASIVIMPDRGTSVVFFVLCVKRTYLCHWIFLLVSVRLLIRYSVAGWEWFVNSPFRIWVSDIPKDATHA